MGEGALGYSPETWEGLLDKALFYAFKQWDLPMDKVENEDFDAFFGIRFRNGVHVADNYMQNQGSVSSILKAHGIGSSSTD